MQSHTPPLFQVNTSCPAAVPPAKGPMVIPVYVYDCHLHSITESLVNRWTFSLPADLHEDMTFTAEGDDNQPSPITRCRLASFDKEASVVEEKEESEFPRPGWRASLDRKSMDSMNEGVGDFKQHCHLISESFFSCFVTGERSYVSDLTLITVSISEGWEAPSSISS